MNTKKLLSAAAAVAVMTSGAMAFDSVKNSAGNATLATDKGGKIQYSSYTQASEFNQTIKISPDRTGNALIYPVFMNDGNFSTEIVVRNSSNHAVVAKAVFYSSKDSEEKLDFNIYLSAKDVCRFKIKDGVVSSNDGSIRTDGIRYDDANGTEHGDYTSIQFANTKPMAHAFSTPGGYVAIFGMVQANSGSSKPGDINETFHNAHDDLYAAYAKLLDDKRPGWRRLLDADVRVGSMFIKDETIAPNITIDDNETTSWSTDGANPDVHSTHFSAVDPDILAGEVRLINEKNGNDMLLPALAIDNYSYKDADDNNKSYVTLWTEGEYASIADRCIDGNNTAVYYEKTCVENDAKQFELPSNKVAIYTYSNEGANQQYNQVVITQPYKRILLQLAESSVHGYKYISTRTSTRVETGAKSYFTTYAKVYDENENASVRARSNGITFSGEEGTASKILPYQKEVQVIRPDAFDQSETNIGNGKTIKDKFGSGNGFAEFNLKGIPAIMTQMAASHAGSRTELNWIYSYTNDNNDY